MNTLREEIIVLFSTRLIANYFKGLVWYIFFYFEEHSRNFTIKTCDEKLDILFLVQKQ